jgi:hypothetical protein
VLGVARVQDILANRVCHDPHDIYRFGPLRPCAGGSGFDNYGNSVR